VCQQEFRFQDIFKRGQFLVPGNQMNVTRTRWHRSRPQTQLRVGINEISFQKENFVTKLVDILHSSGNSALPRDQLL
jgi:hypothetical protein